MKDDEDEDEASENEDRASTAPSSTDTCRGEDILQSPSPLGDSKKSEQVASIVLDQKVDYLNIIITFIVHHSA
jgi:hypothetical protein